MAEPFKGGAEELADISHEVNDATLFEFVAEVFFLGQVFGVEHKVINVLANVDLEPGGDMRRGQ